MKPRGELIEVDGITTLRRPAWGVASVVVSDRDGEAHDEPGSPVGLVETLPGDQW